MKLAIHKNHLDGQILSKNPGNLKNGVFVIFETLTVTIGR